MSRQRARYERGQALLLLLMVIAMGSTWYLVSRLNAESGAAPAIRKARNAEVLNRAKQALIGYIGAQAIKAGENRPGAFPCPVAPADFNDPAANGSDGTVSYPCALPIVGRFPWRTLGLDKLVDATGEPLWYAIASGWAGANTVINSDCASPASGMACATGRLTVDGVASDVIALIIAPGPRVTVSASAGCAAWNQVRATAAPPDWRNYLECENASSPADATFVTTNTNSAFNDQLVTITVGDVMQVIEAAIAKRIEREIAPALKSVFAPASWGFAGSNQLYPYAAVFANPGPGAGTSDYQGATIYSGLLPFNQTQGCTVSATNPRCSNTFMVWSMTSIAPIGGSGSIRYGEPSWPNTCAWESSPANTYFTCDGAYNAPSVSLRVVLRMTKVAMGLRALDLSKVACTAVDDVGAGWSTQTVPCSASVVLQSDGTAIVTVDTSALPVIATAGWGTWATYKIRFERSLIGDHPLLSSTGRFLNFNTGVAQILDGQTVTGLTSGATGIAFVAKFSGMWGTDAAGMLSFSSVTNGPFQSGEALQVSGATKATAAGADYDAYWFTRNEWFRLVYYSAAQTLTAANLPTAPACTTGTNCLSVANLPNPPYTPNAQRAILILGGRSLNGSVRPDPTATLANYLESGNATGAYTRKTVSAGAVVPVAQRFNDRIVVVDSN